MLIQRQCVNPKCNITFSVTNNNDPKKFHNKSCANSYNNIINPRNSTTSNQKRSTKLSRIIKSQKVLDLLIFKSNIVGPYTKVYIKSCKLTGELFYTSSYRTQISPKSRKLLELQILNSFKSMFLIFA